MPTGLFQSNQGHQGSDTASGRSFHQQDSFVSEYISSGQHANHACLEEALISAGGATCINSVEASDLNQDDLCLYQHIGITQFEDGLADHKSQSSNHSVLKYQTIEVGAS
jgi:hypothetical protein